MARHLTKYPGTLAVFFAAGVGVTGCTAGTAPDKAIQPTNAHAPASPTVTYTEHCKEPKSLIACTQLASDAASTIQVLADQAETDGVTIDVKAHRPVYTAALAMTGTELTAQADFQALLLNNGWTLGKRSPHIDVYVGARGGAHSDETIVFHFLNSSRGYFRVQTTYSGRVIAGSR